MFLTGCDVRPFAIAGARPASSNSGPLARGRNGGVAVRLAYNDNLLAKSQLLLKFTAWIAALKTLGAWGVLILAVIDSAAIPMPLDALVASYVFSNPGRAWLYVIAGAVGSAVGCLLPYYLGRAGGELFLLKRIDEAKLQRIRDRFERQEFLALALPATLPPPTPFKLFVFSAGVFEMKLPWFLAAIVSGRLVRFGILAALTVIFGPQIVTVVKNAFHNHPSLTVLAVIGGIALLYVLFRLLRGPVLEMAREMKGK
jgi:membrane protein YqaA with SNARE-associated domain